MEERDVEELRESSPARVDSVHRHQNSPEHSDFLNSSLRRFIDWKISLGGMIILGVQIVGIIAYIVLTLNTIQDLKEKVSNLQTSQNKADISFPLQARDITGIIDLLKDFKRDTGLAITDLNVKFGTLERLESKTEGQLDALMRKSDDLYQASSVPARTPKK